MVVTVCEELNTIHRVDHRASKVSPHSGYSTETYENKSGNKSLHLHAKGGVVPHSVHIYTSIHNDCLCNLTSLHHLIQKPCN